MDDYKKFLKICDSLPDYIRSFFVSKGDSYQIKTKLGYAMDYTNFLNWVLYSCSDKTTATTISEITYKELESLSFDDIDAYLAYLSHYEALDRNGNKMYIENNARAKARKLAAIRELYKYLIKRGYITFNPVSLTETPKIRQEKSIIVLSEEQQQNMLNKALNAKGRPIKKGGATERGRKKAETMRQKVRYRDYAILATFLSTGIRVSELCNINMFDIDFDEQMILIIRKGGSQDHVYFNDMTKEALLDYIELERPVLAGFTKDSEFFGKFKNSDGPLFITGYIKASDELKRITPRRIQQIVKEYASFVAPENEKITPHSLRKTFGTQLFNKYHDLLLVQHALGHADSSTTSKHYVGFDIDRLKLLKK